MLSGSVRPFIEALEMSPVEELPEALGHLKDRVEVFGGDRISAEDVLQPSPVVFLGVEVIFDSVPFSPGCVAEGLNSFPGQIAEVRDPGIQRGSLGRDFAFEKGLADVFSQGESLDPTEVVVKGGA